MEKVHCEMSLLVSSGEDGRVSSAWGGASEGCLEVCFVGLVVVGNYVWYVVIVVIFVKFGGAKSWRDVLKSSSGMAMQATRRDNFYGKKGFSLCNTAVLKLYCKSYWVP